MATRIVAARRLVQNCGGFHAATATATAIGAKASSDAPTPRDRRFYPFFLDLQTR